MNWYINNKNNNKNTTKLQPQSQSHSKLKAKSKSTLKSIFCAALMSAAATNSALAFEGDNYSVSVFGTVGYAISDQRFAYDRITQRGTFAQDSTLGVQLDYQFNNEFGATVQAEFAPANDKDKRWRPELSWAFLSYRPTNDWLFRLGKLRIPSLLYTENMDVGMSYDSVRLPMEVYKTSPIYDFWGVSGSKTFELNNGSSVVWDAYAGYAEFKARIWMSQGIPGVVNSGVHYTPLRAKAAGTVVSWNSFDLQNSLRFGVHIASVRKRDNGDLWLRSPYRIDTPHGYYYNLDPNAYNQGKKDLNVLFFTLSAKWHLGYGVDMVAEGIHRQVLGMKHGYTSDSFHINFRRPIGKFVPYFTFSWIKSDTEALRAANAMSTVQSGYAESATFNAINSVALANLQAADQYSFMLGTSYNLTPNQRLKFEYMRTHIGKYSLYTDSDGNMPPKDKNINTFSMSYNFLF